MAKWTLPDTPDMIRLEDARAMVEAALREMEAVVRKHIYHDSAGTGFAEDAFDDAILALIPNGGGALERALAAERGRAYREGWRFAHGQWSHTGSVPDPDYTPAAIRAQGETP